MPTRPAVPPGPLSEREAALRDSDTEAFHSLAARAAKREKWDAEADERHAWDLYAAHCIQVQDPDDAAEMADHLLAERRKRWGQP